MKKHTVLLALMTALSVGLWAQSNAVSAAEKAYAESGKPLRGTVRPARRGGYAYKYNQGINTRKFTDPTITSQTVAGPFDNGFFFSSPSARNGGDAPYMQ